MLGYDSNKKSTKSQQKTRETLLAHLTHLKSPSRLRSDSTHHLTKHGIILGISLLEDIFRIKSRGTLLNKEKESPINTNGIKILNLTIPIPWLSIFSTGFQNQY